MISNLKAKYNRKKKLSEISDHASDSEHEAIDSSLHETEESNGECPSTLVASQSSNAASTSQSTTPASCNQNVVNDTSPPASPSFLTPVLQHHSPMPSSPAFDKTMPTPPSSPVTSSSQHQSPIIDHNYVQNDIHLSPQYLDISSNRPDFSEVIVPFINF